MASADMLRILTSVDIGPIQAGMAEAASAVQSSTQKMSASFQQAETASQKMLTEAPIIVYNNAAKTATVETTKLAESFEKVSAQDILHSQQQSLAVYTNLLKKAGLTEREVAEQSAIFSKMSAKAQMEEYLALTQIVEMQQRRAVVAVEAGTAEVAANTASSGSVMETRHAIMGLSEMIGVHTPRHITSFLSHLGPVSAVMTAAFAPIAVIGLISVLAQIPEQLEKGISALRGWNEEAQKNFKESTEAAAQAEIKFLHFAETVKTAQATAGLSGMTKIKSEQEAVAEQLSIINAKYNKASAELTGYQNILKMTEFHMKPEDITQPSAGIARYITSMFTGKEVDQAKVKIEELKGTVKSLKDMMNDLTTKQSMLGVEAKPVALTASRELVVAQTEAAQRIATIKLDTDRKVTAEEYKLGWISLDQRLAREKLAAAEELKINQALIAAKRAQAIADEKLGTPAGPKLVNLKADEVTAQARYEQQIAAIENTAAVEAKVRFERSMKNRIDDEKTLQLELLKGRQEAIKQASAMRQIDTTEETRQLLEVQQSIYDVQRRALANQLLLAQAGGEKEKEAAEHLARELLRLEAEFENNKAQIKNAGVQKQAELDKASFELMTEASLRAAERELASRMALDNRRLSGQQITAHTWAVVEIAAVEEWYLKTSEILNAELAHAELLYGQQSREYQAVLNKMTEADRKRAAEKDKIHLTEENKNRQSLEHITQQFNSNLLRMGQGQQTLSQMWVGMWNGMVSTFEANMLKMAEQWMAQVLFQKSMAKNEVLVHAKKGAAGAYSAMAGIPYIGPVLGAIAAGTTFAAIMAFGSFKQGGVLDKDMMMFGHAKEMVLPADISLGLQNMIRGGSGSNGDGGAFHTSIVSSPTLIGDKSFLEKAMRLYPSILSNEVKRGVRRGSIRPSSVLIPGYRL
jgi:hypothetical protein